MQEYFEQKQSDERRIPAMRPISETITISVAEYHFLTKAATLLETVLHAKYYQRDAVVGSVQAVVEEMTKETTEVTSTYSDGTVKRTVTTA